MAKKPEEELEAQVALVVAQQQELATQTDAMMNDPKFRQFMELQRSVNDKASEVWKAVETGMIENNIKSLKGEWGSITVAERNNYSVPDIKLLPTKFVKKVPDTTKIGQAHKLEDKLPKGVLVNVTKYLVKRLK